MNRIAKKRRKEGNPNIWGPDELVPFKDRFSVKEVLITWIRPFRMFLTEPIVLVLSLLSGFSDALVFMFIQSFSIVYKQWNFTTIDIGLSFIPIGVGYFIAWGLFIPAIRRNIKERQAKPNDERAQYESRLWWLLYTAPCLPIGLFGFAWTILGPPVHWIGSMIFAAIIGIANYSIYMATIGLYPLPSPSSPSNISSDYMICAYGPYSASATGGNGWSRDFLAGVLTVPATPFFTNIGKSSGLNLEYASTILACISTILVIAVYLIYYYGPTLRERSPFAQQLANARNEQQGRRVSTIAGLYGSSRRASKLSRFYHWVFVIVLTRAIRLRIRNGSSSQRQRRAARQRPKRAKGIPCSAVVQVVSTTLKGGRESPEVYAAVVESDVVLEFLYTSFFLSFLIMKSVV